MVQVYAFSQTMQQKKHRHLDFVDPIVFNCVNLADQSSDRMFKKNSFLAKDFDSIIAGAVGLNQNWCSTKPLSRRKLARMEKKGLQRPTDDRCKMRVESK